ncbi:MAG: hypothetical protein QXK62_09635, partial [Thermoproteus sp.]
TPPPLPPPPPPPPSLSPTDGVVVRTGRLVKAYLLKTQTPEVHPREVLVVVGREWYVLRPVGRQIPWVSDDAIKIRGRHIKFPFGVIMHRMLLDYSSLLAWGKIALIAMRLPHPIRLGKRLDPRLAPYSREVYEIAASPAVVTLVRLGDRGPNKTAIGWLNKGSYAYCHTVNQLLAQIGVGARLIC